MEVQKGDRIHVHRTLDMAPPTKEEDRTRLREIELQLRQQQVR